MITLGNAEFSNLYDLKSDTCMYIYLLKTNSENILMCFLILFIAVNLYILDI